VFDIGEHRAPQVTPPVSVKIVKLSGPSEVTQGKLHFGTTRRMLDDFDFRFIGL